MKKKEIVIGTRGSKLALWQANWVKDSLMSWYSDVNVSLNIIKTKGDKILDSSLAAIGGKGLFVKEIEDALLSSEVDIAVHSMKDMPAEQPEGLIIAAVPEREDPRDILISKDGKGLKDLPDGASIGTTSLRRKTQLFKLRPSLNVTQLRGNLDTRIKRVDEGKYDAIIVAAAGVRRLGFSDRITEYLPLDKFIPAIAQGALGIEAREDDKDILHLLKKFNHEKTFIEVTAERAFLKRLQGGCQVPIAAYALIDKDNKDRLNMVGMVSSIDGKNMLKEKDHDTVKNAAGLGIRLADKLLKRGADKILAEIYGKEI